MAVAADLAAAGPSRDGSHTAPGITVHVVGRLTAPVLGFLLPTMKAMHAVGTRQLLLCLEGSGIGSDALPAGVQLLQTPDRAHALGRMLALQAALGGLSASQPVAALHLHGLLPGMAAMRWLRRPDRATVAVVFSPHGSRALARSRLTQSLAATVLRLGLGHARPLAIVNMRPELAQLGGMAASLIESPVPRVFFETGRNEARRPLLITCGLDGQRSAVDTFVRLAVLLTDDALGIGFNWVGGTQPEAAAALRAAGIGQFDAATDALRAQRLGTAWIYVAASEEHGFPVRLAEAMACGLPCVALDTPNHRSVIAEGESGYLCADLAGLLARIALLLDSPAQRQRMGQAARQLAVQRFDEAQFGRQLLAAIEPAAQQPPNAQAKP